MANDGPSGIGGNIGDEKRGKELTDHQIQGQSDYSSGKYEPPHSIGILDSIVQPEYSWDKLLEDNKPTTWGMTTRERTGSPYN